MLGETNWVSIKGSPYGRSTTCRKDYNHLLIDVLGLTDEKTLKKIKTACNIGNYKMTRVNVPIYDECPSDASKFVKSIRRPESCAASQKNVPIERILPEMPSPEDTTMSFIHTKEDASGNTGLHWDVGFAMSVLFYLCHLVSLLQ